MAALFVQETDGKTYTWVATPKGSHFLMDQPSDAPQSISWTSEQIGIFKVGFPGRSDRQEIVLHPDGNNWIGLANGTLTIRRGVIYSMTVPRNGLPSK